MEKVKNGDDLDSSKSPPQEKEYPSWRERQKSIKCRIKQQKDL
jgi:hypothetical protein